MGDIWISSFDNREPRSVERQLCLMRDAAQSLVAANRSGDFENIERAQRNVDRTAMDADLLLSGILSERAQRSEAS